MIEIAIALVVAAYLMYGYRIALELHTRSKKDKLIERLVARHNLSTARVVVLKVFWGLCLLKTVLLWPKYIFKSLGGRK